jgi:hypothetical protein
MRTAAQTASQPGSDARHTDRPKKSLWRRVLLVAAMILATLNIWTGSPVLALWVGSKVQGSYSTLTMSAVGAVVLVLAAMVFLLARAIAWLDIRYADAVGRPPKARQVRPWLRSLAGKYGDPKKVPQPLTALEWVLVVMVVIVVVLFEGWFFFFAGSPLPKQ